MKKMHLRKAFRNSFLCLWLLAITAFAAAQNKSISGTVTDPQGEPLVGVTIMASGTQNGTITDSDGQFNLSVPEDVKALKFSFIGMKNKKVKIGNRSTLEVVMQPEEFAMDEVVVIGYGSKTKADLVTSVTQVKAEEVIKDRSVPSATNALQGTVAGVKVTTDRGVPGEGFEIDIRGQSSVNYAGVHVVLDGVPSDMSALYDLNPADIESMSVLKDAASTAIYGSRGAGGVILIETKKANQSGISVSYTGNASLQKPATHPDFASPYEYALASNLAYENSGRSPRYTTEHLNAIQDPNVEAIPNETGEEWLFAGNTDWFDLMFDQAFQQTHNIAIAGGGQRTKYRLSIGYLDQDGFFSEYGPDNYERLNSTLNLNTELSDNLDVDIRLNYTKSHRNRARLYPDRDVYGVGGFLPVRDPNGNYAAYDYRSPNPIQAMEEGGFREDKDDKLQVDGTITWEPLHNLTLKAIGSYDYRVDRGTSFNRAFGYYGPNGLVEFSHRGRPNEVDEKMEYRHGKKGQLMADYDFQIGARHDFNLTGVWVAEDDGNRQVRVNIENIAGNELPSFLLGDQSTVRTRGRMQHGASVSAISRLSYNYDNRYLLEASLGAEANYRFPPENRWGSFPALSGGWRIAQEDFMDDLPFVNQLKFRVSWGQTGNSSGINRFDYIPTYEITNPYAFAGGSAQGITTYGITTRDKEWERITMVNYGLDVSLFENRFYLTAEKFKNHTDNMLISKELPSVIGNLGDSRRNPVGNYGGYQVEGWELTVGWREQYANGFNYEFSFNVADRNSEITDLDSDVEQEFGEGRYRQRDANMVGYPAGWNYFGYESDGLFQSQEEVDNWATQDNETGPGDIKFVDQNGDGEINDEDAVWLGDFEPHYTYGITLGAGYKNFDVKAIFSGVGKQNYYMDRNAVAPFYRDDHSAFETQMDFWTPDNPDARYPRPYRSGRHNYVYTDYWMIDGSYLKLTSLTLGYDLPRTLLERINIQDARLTLNGENLFTVSGVPDFLDPSTGRYDRYPALRGYSIGLNITF